MRKSKRYFPALFLCFFFGSFGLHRFYLGRIKSAFLMAFTLGGLGIWSLTDLFLLLFRRLKMVDIPHPPGGMTTGSRKR